MIAGGHEREAGDGQRRRGLAGVRARWRQVGRIALPERCTNVCFGGLKRNRLFTAAGQLLYALRVNTSGAPSG
jgi:sugar lactone lactonase YvrE